FVAAMTRNDEYQLVAVHDVTVFVHHQHAIAIPVEGDSEIGTFCAHARTTLFGVRGYAAIVDVETVGIDTCDNHVRAELVEHTRSDVVRRTVRAIEHDLEPMQTKPTIDGCFAELDVTTSCVVDAPDLADLFG